MIDFELEKQRYNLTKQNYQMSLRTTVLRKVMAFLVMIFVSSIALSQECGIIFVTPNGASSGAAGTRANPADLTYGLSLVTANDNVLWLGMGTYAITQPLQIPSDVTIEGGFDPGNQWVKSNATPTILAKDASNVIPAPANALVGLAGLNVSGFRLQDLTITVPDATTPQGSVYGIYLSGCSNYNIVRCEVTTGNGAPGAPGQQGLPGAAGADGAPGQPGYRGETPLPGGTGGAGGGGSGANGGNGANGGKHASFGPGSNGLPAGCGGTGGETPDGPGCSASCIFGDPSCGSVGPGTPGTAGGNGSAGTSGTTGPVGSVVGGYYVPGSAGGVGGQGTPGCGGGGGGGGAGRQRDQTDDTGGSGGGGGGGGEGGFGGVGGTGGGGSFAIFLDNNGAGGNIVDCFLNPGAGGAGGAGGPGGPGGAGGQGGPGGGPGPCGNSTGAAGGAGGQGGPGGAGGQGATGTSAALQENGGTPATTSNITNVPGNLPIISVQNGGCTNSSVLFSSPNGAPWNFGTGAQPGTDFGAGPIAVSYSTTGRRTITFDGTVFTDFIGIYNDGPTLPSITPANPQVDVGCPNDYTTALVGTQYDWSFGSNALPPVVSGPNEQTATGVIFAAPGTYTIYVRVMTACCGEVLDSTTVTVVQSNLNVNLTESANPICAGDAVDFTADGSFAAYNFFVNGTSVQSGVSNIYNDPNLQDGDEVFVIAFAGTCFTNPSDTVTMQVNPIPSVTLASSDPDDEICEGDPVTFTASPAGLANYEFFDGGTSLQSGASETYTTTALAVGNSITVVATDGGCESVPSNAITTIVNPAPAPSLVSSDPDNAICVGDNITFTATPTGQSSYEFFEDGASVQNTGANTYSPANLASGTSIWVIATSTLGCVSPASDTITTAVNPIPSVTLTSSDPDNEICQGESITFTATPSGYNNYEFLDNSTSTQATSSNIWTTTTLQSGNSITVVPTDNGCVGQASSAIVTTVITAPTVNAGSDIDNCIDDGNVILAGFSPSGGTWTGNGIIAPTGTFSPSGAGAGTHELYYSASNSNCTTTDTILAVVNPLPSIEAGDNRTICDGDEIELFGGGAVTYSWSPTTALSNPTSANPFATPNTTTTYTLTGTDANGCVNSDDVTITVEPVPVVDFITQPICCVGDTMFFTNLATPTSGVTYYWEFDDDSTSIDTMPTHLYDAAGIYDVTLTVTWGNCSSATTVPSTVFPRPMAGFYALPEVTSFLDPEIVFSNSSIDSEEWFWDFADSTYSDEENPVHFYQDTGIHNVMLVATNEFGCTDTVYGEVNITPYTTLYVPSSFSPNGDEINDVFFAYGEDIFSFEMRIFNRWGEQVFFTKDINTGWDGRDYDILQDVAEGIYTYRIIVEDFHFRKHSYAGKIVLYR